MPLRSPQEMQNEDKSAHSGERGPSCGPALALSVSAFVAGEEVFAKQSHLTAVARPGSIAATYPDSNMRPAYSASARGVSGLGHVHTLPAPLARAGAFPWCSEMLQCAPMSRLPLNTAALQLNQ